MGIEVAELHGFALAVLHLCNEMRSISIGIVYQGALLVGKEAVYIACCLLARFERSPFLVVASRGGLASSQVRAIYIIGGRAGVGNVIHHDGWVVTNHTLTI